MKRDEIFKFIENYLFIKLSTRPMAYQPDGDRGQNLNPILNVGAASTL